MTLDAEDRSADLPYLEALDNPQAVTRTFTAIPKLAGVLLSVNVAVQLRRVELRIRVDTAPDLPPGKWDPRCNAAALRFTLHGAVAAYLGGLPAKEAAIRLRVARTGPGGLRLWSEPPGLDVTFESLHLDGIEPYVV